MKVHEAEVILKYYADIPQRIEIIRRQCAALNDEIDPMRGMGTDGMPHGGAPGDSTAAMACRMEELGIGEQLCSDYALVIKVYANKLWVYDREKYKEKTAAWAVYEEAQPFNPNALCIEPGSFKWSTKLTGTYTGGVYTLSLIHI